MIVEDGKATGWKALYRDGRYGMLQSVINTELPTLELNASVVASGVTIVGGSVPSHGRRLSSGDATITLRPKAGRHELIRALPGLRALASGAGGAGKRIVDEEIERCGAMRVAGILDLRDELLHQPAIIDRLRLQPLFLAVFDLFQIGVIQRHFVPHEKFSAALRCRT